MGSVQCSAGGSGGSNGGAVCWCGRPSADPRQFRPFYSLLPQRIQLMGDGGEQQVCRRAYRANQLGYCCFTRTETRAKVLDPLPIEAW